MEVKMEREIICIMEQLNEKWLHHVCPEADRLGCIIGVSGDCMNSDHAPIRIKDGSDIALKRIAVEDLLHSGKYINKAVVITIEGVPVPLVKEFTGCRLYAPRVTEANAFEAFRCGKLTAQEFASFKYYNPTETTFKIEASKILLAFEVEDVLN